MQKLLIIGYIWPEPHRTAAGYRMLQLIDLFIDKQYAVVFCSAAKIKSTSSSSLEERAIPMIPIALNDDGFDQMIATEMPDIVLYDRFLIEEQFGWRVRRVVPEALQILDTEDLHFLRDARKNKVENAVSLESGFKSVLAVREISSILRVDVSLIISTFEMQLLQTQFQIDSASLLYLPFLIKKAEVENRRAGAVPFESRKDFCTIGNLKHAPNLDAVRQLKHTLWPLIKEQLPEAQLYIYGSNAPREVLEMHDPSSGFHIKGHAVSVDEVLSKHKVLLAPLRYGAGLKGKLFDAMKNGIPSVMTPVAAEAMFSTAIIPGAIHPLGMEFAMAAVHMRTDPIHWSRYQHNGFQILQEDYEESAFAKALFSKIQNYTGTSKTAPSFVQQMLSHHADAHFKFMSYWINSKG